MTIKSGYMLQVTSWENDGDCYNTKTLVGLTEDEVRAKIILCKVLNEIGQEELNDSLREEIASKASLLVEEVDDLVYDLVGFSYENPHMRVCESWTVHYIPFEIPEVTDRF